MNERQEERFALLRTIATEQDNADPIRVYSDWLKEYGDDQDIARAEFIDASLLLDGKDIPEDNIPRDSRHRGKFVKYWGRVYPKSWKKLLDDLGCRWHANGSLWISRESATVTGYEVTDVTRGMMSGVQAKSITACMDTFPLLLSQPVTSFGIKNYYPFQMRILGNEYGWFPLDDGRPWLVCGPYLPPKLWELMRDSGIGGRRVNEKVYATKADAELDLTLALLKWAVEYLGARGHEL